LRKVGQSKQKAAIPMFDLKDALPFLLNRTGIRTAELFEARELAKHDVSLSMYRVLATLSRHDDQRLGDLAALTDMEVSTLSRLIGAMQTRRLVSRRRSGKDARAVRIRITDHGRALAQKLIAAATHYEAAMTRSLVPRQVQELKRALTLIHDTVATLESEFANGAKTKTVRRASAA
jgi:MarR family transcriptional regulator, organic hydroperoxide resistance regulator